MLLAWCDMRMNTASEMPELPPQVAAVLDTFLRTAQDVFGPVLRAAVLYGSAAEGRLRATSDVNLILVLATFDKTAVDRLRDAARVAHAAIQLQTMFLLEREIPAAVEAFPQKFSDILRRRRALVGHDPFAGLAISRTAELFHLKQQLVNLVLRLRATYVGCSLREEQLALALAEVIGPLRSCAGTLLALEGSPAASSREALRRIAAGEGAPFTTALTKVAEVRDTRSMLPGDAAPTAFCMMELAGRMYARARRLDEVRP